MNKQSSGAKKAEELTRKNTKKPTAKKTGGSTKKTVAEANKDKKVTESTAEKKKQANKIKKAEEAKVKAERKQKKLEKKLEHKQKRLERVAALKEKLSKRREERKERRETLRHETKEARAKRRTEAKRAKIEARVARRKAAAAEREARREHRLKVRAQKRADRQERKHAPGFGGWLAAVIALGVTTLALGTMTTFGWLKNNGMQAQMTSVYTESLYELNSIVDNLDANLSKARISNSAQDRVAVFTDIAIESEMAELILERMPVETNLTQNMTAFVNNMGDSAQSILKTVANGKPMTDSQHAAVEYMYTVNRQMKGILNELVSASDSKEMIKALKGSKDSLMIKSFDELQNNTVETPKEINDGPFADNKNKTGAKNLDALEEITAPRAEELAKDYFKDYKLTEVRCTGEAVAQTMTVYNVELKTDDGEMFAQISKKGGKVIMFDSYKDCTEHNFSVDRCIDIAKEFLSALGIDGMQAVWTSENGTTCNLNFAYEKDGVIFYPDMIKLKVCEERGIVTGMEGVAYALNHTDRNVKEAEISKAEAKSKLFEGFEVEGVRLSVVPVDDNEVLAYEFYGAYDGNDYYIYVDALTGEEVQVLTVVGTKQGRALM